MNILIFYTAIFLIVLEAVIEAIFNTLDNNSPNRAHRFIEKYHALVAIFFFTLWADVVYFIPNETPDWKLVCGFIGVRFLIYDTIWNITSIWSGNPDVTLWGYGLDKFYDRTMTKLGSFGWFVKFCFGVVGIVFLFGIQEQINHLLKSIFVGY